jgi:Short C-terminal domain
VVTTAPASSGSQTETKLLELKSLLDKGLITTEEYEQKRTLILKGM